MPELPIYVQKVDCLNQIILNLYSDASKGMKKYLDFLTRLQGAIYFDFGSIAFYAKNQNDYEIESFCQIGWGGNIETAYLSYYYKKNDVIPIFETKTPVVLRNTDIFDESRKKSEYYKKFIQPAGFDYSLECNIMLPLEANSYGICSLHRKSPKQSFNCEEKKIIEFLQPHLSNCAHIDKTNDNNFDGSLEGNNNLFGTLILEQNGDINFISEAFKKILFKYSGGKDLHKCLKEIYRVADKVTYGNSSRTLYQLSNDGGTIEIIREISGERQRVLFHCYIYDVMGIISENLKRIEKEYNMTSTETKILECIMQGKRREEIATEVYTSVSSVKKNIASIYRKMNINNQMQILKKLGIMALPDKIDTSSI